MKRHLTKQLSKYKLYNEYHTSFVITRSIFLLHLFILYINVLFSEQCELDCIVHTDSMIIINQNYERIN